jgi:hypothetical protein
MMHGKGESESPKGNKYNGRWANGQRHGFGTYHTSDGMRFYGIWRNNKRHDSNMRCLFPNGDMKYGTWEDGIFKGFNTVE